MIKIVTFSLAENPHAAGGQLDQVLRRGVIPKENSSLLILELFFRIQPS
jgi:hypothetical protein